MTERVQIFLSGILLGAGGASLWWLFAIYVWRWFR
jgi:hypothetical protein